MVALLIYLERRVSMTDKTLAVMFKRQHQLNRGEHHDKETL